MARKSTEMRQTTFSNYDLRCLSGTGVLQFLIFFCFMSAGLPAFAQFTVTEDFRGSGSPDIILGGGGGTQGEAYLTSGVADPVGAGWLRLNNSLQNQRGYAYVNRTFPSTLGLIVDFEYKMWRNTNSASGGNGSIYDWGGDGLSVFLFDGQYGPVGESPQPFRLGGWGGSLGYARNTAQNPQVTQGLGGGYIGIGLDAYGNFGNNTEGKFGGIQRDDNNNAEIPNTVILRGPTTSNYTSDVVGGIRPSNEYLGGIKLGNRSGTPQQIMNRDEIDYNTKKADNIRPTDSEFYRRVQIEIMPTGTAYAITVRWAQTPNGAFTNLITYTTQQPPPDLLKIGFAASTGGAINYHEIRNLIITTPGNLRLTKHANKDVLRSIPTSSGTANQISYTVQVVNDTPADLTGIAFTDRLTDGNGVLVDPSMFTITSISHTGFNAGTTLPTPSPANPLATNEFTGSLNLAAGVTGYITVTGTLSGIPAGNVLRNTATVEPTDITDEDLSNNTAVTNTPVIAENVDLVPLVSVDDYCLDPTGNTFEVRVANVGAEDAEYMRRGHVGQRIVVTKEVPAGYTFIEETSSIRYDTGSGQIRWHRIPATLPTMPSSTPYTVTYVANYHPSGSGSTLQTLAGNGIIYQNDYPIRYTLIPPAGTTSYTDQVSVDYRAAVPGESDAYNGASIEATYDPDNSYNNTVSTTINQVPGAPTVASPTVYLCQGTPATPLQATASDGNTLLWYTDEDGFALFDAPVPSTANVGSRTYFVSQTNGNCEGPLTPVEVIVLSTPTAGSISGTQEICRATVPEGIASQQAGTGGGTINYRWEFSIDGGETWNIVSGESSASYQPGNLTQTTYYRRVTIATQVGGSCESAATADVVITVKECKLITNPMLRSRTRNQP